jgi:hypothetical protein
LRDPFSCNVKAHFSRIEKNISLLLKRLSKLHRGLPEDIAGSISDPGPTTFLALGREKRAP